MTNLCDDRVRLVGVALPMAARMDVHVGHDAQPRRAAVGPQSTKPTAVDFNDAGRQRIGIDIVIEDEFFDLPPLASSAKKKGARLALAVRSVAQLIDACPPNLAATSELRRLPEDDARER
ncbi:hypothetical protein [Mesorhizobium sp. M7A.F.Ca.US.001.04.2.1]|uniref:hypothetical protein n=1 Tax=Mesorhizobium sp. M7A.F.Ca.US.001.04.2.1 TaxID=2496727 RepID=UPI0013DF8BD6|nr:hypothetical protein [Mesorhizobium sp. M7A.F.Ca.US.001.04.2.1]